MFKNYVLTAYKVFMRRKLFTAINLLCISLTLVVLMVVTALLQNAFYPSGVEGKSERFLQVSTLTAKSKDGDSTWISQPGYKLIEKYLSTLKSVEMVAVVSGNVPVSIYQDDRVNVLNMRRADANYWKILDFEVLAGRVPNTDDVNRGRFVAVLNRTSAQKLFPGRDAIGQKVNVSGQQFEIIGVVEDVLQLNAYADIWAPISTYPSTEYRQQMMGGFSALLLARSAKDLPAIQREVEQVSKRIVFDDPEKWARAIVWADSKLDYFARSITGREEVADSGATMLVTGIALLMFLFMLLPALNLVNLNTGRIMERSSEIGVRKAFGASSRQLVAQFVTENILLCLVGGVLGLLGTKGAIWGLEQSGLIPYLRVELNLAVFGLGLLITVIFGLLSGVIPAWKMSRLNPVSALKGAN